MKCETAQLQAYADGALAPDTAKSLEQHLMGCAACRAELQAIADRRNEVATRLAILEPSPDEIPGSYQALASFRSGTLRAHSTPWNIFRRKVKTMKQNLFTGRWRPVSIGVTAAVFLAVLVSIAPVRHAAADFLGIFRVRKFAAVAVDPAQAQRIEELAHQLDEGAFGEPSTVREAGAPQPVADATQASAAAGFEVRTPADLPDGASLESFDTQTGPALHFEIDGPTLQALLSAAGVDNATLPDMGTMTADVDLTVMVSQEYSLAGGGKLTVMQAASPEVAFSDGVDPVVLGEFGLQALGIPAGDAQRMAREIDWASTLIVPLPTDIARSTEVTVDGVTGLLLEATQRNRLGQNNMLMWEKDDILYAISGENVESGRLIQVGDSLH